MSESSDAEQPEQLKPRKPSKKKDKPFTNPFGVFMAERRKQLQASGRTFAGGWKEVAALLDAEWRAMTEEDKEKYKIAASEAKEAYNKAKVLNAQAQNASCSSKMNGSPTPCCSKSLRQEIDDDWGAGGSDRSDAESSSSSSSSCHPEESDSQEEDPVFVVRNVANLNRQPGTNSDRWSSSSSSDEGHAGNAFGRGRGRGRGRGIKYSRKGSVEPTIGKVKPAGSIIDALPGVPVFKQPPISQEEMDYESAYTMYKEGELIDSLLAESENFLNEWYFVLCCSALCSLPGRQMLPAEFSCAVFTVSEGLYFTFDGMFEPGEVPLGMRSIVQDSCDYYGIPFPGTHEGSGIPDIMQSTDSAEVFELLRVWISRIGIRWKDSYVFFAMKEDIPIIKSCLRYWARKAGREGEDEQFKGISLSLLIQKISEYADWPEYKPILKYEAQADPILLNTRFAYHPKMGCGWHEKVDNGHKVHVCTGTKIRMWVYNALGYLRHLFALGTHVPETFPSLEAPIDQLKCRKQSAKNFQMDTSCNPMAWYNWNSRELAENQYVIGELSDIPLLRDLVPRMNPNPVNASSSEGIGTDSGTSNDSNSDVDPNGEAVPESHFSTDDGADTYYSSEDTSIISDTDLEPADPRIPQGEGEPIRHPGIEDDEEFANRAIANIKERKDFVFSDASSEASFESFTLSDSEGSMHGMEDTGKTVGEEDIIGNSVDQRMEEFYEEEELVSELESITSASALARKQMQSVADVVMAESVNATSDSEISLLNEGDTDANEDRSSRGPKYSKPIAGPIDENPFLSGNKIKKRQISRPPSVASSASSKVSSVNAGPSTSAGISRKVNKDQKVICKNDSGSGDWVFSSGSGMDTDSEKEAPSDLEEADRQSKKEESIVFSRVTAHLDGTTTREAYNLRRKRN